MPRFLKNETNRRLIVSQRALTLAFSLLATPKTIGHEENETDGAIEIGLIGIAADLAISACLYEILGEKGIRRERTGFYLTAPEALDSFRRTLASSIPRLATLTHGVENPAAHLKKLTAACAGFPVLFTARAAAVHSGAGTSYDVAFCAGKSVADFLLALAESPKWKPSLRQVPAIPKLPKERTLIAQELAALLATGEKSKIATSLAGIFLVLPELTPEEPDWLQTLQRVQVTPRNRDISVLVKSLQHAKVGDLYKVGKGASAIATKMDPTNPNALPIYLTSMKKKFDKPSDAWSAYIGTANGALERGILSLPPIEDIYAFAATGIEGIGLPFEETTAGLSAHSLWPFVAEALHYNGTKGPCFFLIRTLKEGEFGQLIALLTKAAASSKKIQKALKEYQPLFKAVAMNQGVAASSMLAKSLTKVTQTRDERREKLVDVISSRANTATGKLKAGYEALVTEVQKSDTIASPLILLCEGEIDMESARFPALRLMIDAANAHEDLGALATALAKAELQPVSTNIRKAILEIDYSFFGPQLSP